MMFRAKLAGTSLLLVLTILELNESFQQTRKTKMKIIIDCVFVTPLHLHRIDASFRIRPESAEKDNI